MPADKEEYTRMLEEMVEQMKAHGLHSDNPYFLNLE